MKNTSLIIAVGALAGIALSTASLHAGTSYGKGKTPLPPPVMPMDNLLDPIETTLSSGYDTDYMFRGFNRGKDAIWTGLDLSMPIGLPVGNFVGNVGFWYINPTDSRAAGLFGGRGMQDDELNIYASLGTTLGAFDVSVGWTHYSYLDNSGSGLFSNGVPSLGDQDEVGINIGTTVDTPWIPIDFGAAYYYNMDIGDPWYLFNAGLGTFSGAPGFPFSALNSGSYSDLEHYFEASMGTTLDLTDRMALALGAVGGWYSDNFHGVTFTAAFPIQVAENVVFEPYVSYLLDESSGNLHDAYINPGNAVTQDQFFGGVSLSVSF